MKEFLKKIIAEDPATHHARNKVREYLQALILQSLQYAGAMTQIAFHGGTALRFLFNMPRYSEDLDFTLERHTDIYDPDKLVSSVFKELSTQGFTTKIKSNLNKNVQSIRVAFPGLLKELGLSPHGSESLAVKIEIDTNPPSGVGLSTTLIRKYHALHLQHHDPSSLLAGKIHAILQRRYTKGRDWYDLFWYLTDPNWPAPNFTLLNNALLQSGWQKDPVDENNWREFIGQKLSVVDFVHVRRDVEPFLEDAREAGFLTQVTFVKLMGKNS